MATFCIDFLRRLMAVMARLISQKINKKNSYIK